MPAHPRIPLVLAVLIVAFAPAASADTGYRIKIAAGPTMTANDAWTAVDEINRPDPESMCRTFNAVQFVVPLNQATQPLEQSLLKHETVDRVEMDFTRPDRPYVRIELRNVTVTNIRTLDKSKQRITLRYASCSVKEKKAGSGG